jgi:phosphate transport system protein
MPTSADSFVKRTDRLKEDLVDQGKRVQAMLEGAFEALFDRNAEKAHWVMRQDDVIDAVDVQLEQSSVALLIEATRQGAELDSQQLRAVLMIVKINNELERIADVAVDLAELLESGGGSKGGVTPSKYPDTFRVMANSVIGIIRDTCEAVAKNDPATANIVLQSQHAVTAFKSALLKDAEGQLSRGTMTVDFAFQLHEIATQCELVADHCTNISEQVIYTTTGAIVRHMQSSWVEVGRPGA